MSSPPPIRVAAPKDDSLVTHVTHKAMATNFVVLLPAHQSKWVETVVEALELLDQIEARLTIYRPTSEVAKLNQQAPDSWFKLSAETYQLIEKSLLWSQRTSGAFDITAGPLVEAWGFTQRSGRKPSQAEIQSALSLVGFQNIELESETRSVHFAKAGMAINLGAIGKGDALDALTRYLKHAGVDDFLIHGGASSVVARGDQVEGSGLGWAVGLSHPTKPRHRLAGIWLKDVALATSGSGKQHFHHRGKRYGHVIDPRTGYPAGEYLSLTVVMKRAADADACATALFVAGEDERKEWETESWWPAQVTMAASDRQDSIRIGWQGDVIWVEE